MSEFRKKMRAKYGQPCPERVATCEKKRTYATKQQAQNAADLFQFSNIGDQEPYQCPLCKLFHLATKKNKRRT